MRVLFELTTGFVAGSGQTGGVDLVVQQIRTIGPRQWLSLVAGSIMSNAPAVAPVSQRIATYERALSGGHPTRDPELT